MLDTTIQGRIQGGGGGGGRRPPLKGGGSGGGGGAAGAPPLKLGKKMILRDFSHEIPQQLF